MKTIHILRRSILLVVSATAAMAQATASRIIRVAEAFLSTLDAHVS